MISQKTKRIAVLFSEEDFELIKKASELQGLSYSAFLRTSSLAKARVLNQS